MNFSNPRPPGPLAGSFPAAGAALSTTPAARAGLKTAPTRGIINARPPSR